MKTSILTLALLGTLTLSLADATSASNQNIDTQISKIQNAPAQERVELMNQFKQQLANMNYDDRSAAMSQMQMKMGGNNQDNDQDNHQNNNQDNHQNGSMNHTDEMQSQYNNDMGQMQNMNQNQAGNQYIHQEGGQAYSGSYQGGGSSSGSTQSWGSYNNH